MSRVVRRLLSLGVALLVTVGLGVTPAAAADPGLIGSLDTVAAQPDGTIRVSGWALAREGGPVAVHVYDSGPSRTVGTDLGTAWSSRPDVAAVFGQSRVGFDRTVATAERGTHNVCVYAVADRIAGRSVALIGCRSVATGFAPIGSIDVIPTRSVEGQQIRVSGWAYDPDQPQTPLGVHAYVYHWPSDPGEGAALLTTPVSRPDVAAAFRGVGPQQGFTASVNLDHYVNDGFLSGWTTHVGRLSVCLFAIGVGNGGNTLLGCRDIDVDRKVNAALDSVSSSGLGSLTVRGWSYIASDPAATTQNHIDLRSAAGFPTFGQDRAEFPADQPRPDVERVFAGVGANHGYQSSTRLIPGRYTVCVTTRSYTGPPIYTDRSSRQECRDTEVVNAFGAVDSVVIGEAGPGTVTIRGWAVDPFDRSASVLVRAAVRPTLNPNHEQSNAVPVVTAVPRPDVNAAFGISGVHGYEIVLDATQDLALAGGRACVMADAFSFYLDICAVAFASADVTVG